MFFAFQSWPSWHCIDNYKLTGDPANPTSPGFPFLPGSPFKVKKKKGKVREKQRGFKCSLLRLDDKSIADKRLFKKAHAQSSKQYKSTGSTPDGNPLEQVSL